ncbi:MAG: T9SS type A sorting domain-containing protein [Flavobacteriales bacterium]|nr:T9SS type A sorting domain-containing protein [Flavobacteriales bacterium]
MKKIKLFTIALAFLGSNTFAQITVTDADLVGVGDIIYQAYDTVPGTAITPGNTGANQSWDFSTLQVMDWDTTEFISPTGTPYASLYPNANICINEDGEFLYINKSTTGIELVGWGNIPVNMLLLPLPLTYGLTYSDGPNTIMDSSMENMFIPDSLAPFISLNPLHDKVDSLNISVTLTNDFNVDAWGDVTIPMGTYASLRVNAQETSTTSWSAYCSNSAGIAGGGWYPIPQQLFPSETEITNRYQWWSNDATVKFVVADLEVDSIGNVIDASFLTIPQTSAIAELTSNTFKVYPIPTTYQLNIESADADLSTYKMYDMLGNLILENSFEKNTKVDLSNVAKGTYLLNISTKKGSITKKIIVE